MGGIIGIIVAIFGLFWTFFAVSVFPPMALFGIIFVVIAIVGSVYNFKNATSENRYSEFDIVDDTEESDPLNARFEKKSQNAVEVNYTDVNKAHYCPYCGACAPEDYKYCSVCGRLLP